MEGFFFPEFLDLDFFLHHPAYMWVESKFNFTPSKSANSVYMFSSKIKKNHRILSLIKKYICEDNDIKFKKYLKFKKYFPCRCGTSKLSGIY